MTLSPDHNKISPKDLEESRGKLLAWYKSHDRDVPWRIKPGQKPDAYKIWLSEIMCQQTTIGAVKAYYAKFLALWPDVKALADAREEDVMAAWAGLGYYARARNLHKCAKVVAYEYQGRFPHTQEALKRLPGIGDYTAAAIAAIVYGARSVVVDGNIERVMARFYAVVTQLPAAKKDIKAAAANYYSDDTSKPGDLAQALMDLGASVCLPKIPRCETCPLNNACLGYKSGIAPTLPRKPAKKAKPLKRGYVFWVEGKDGCIGLIQNPPEGLFGSMLTLPTSTWEGALNDTAQPFSYKAGRTLSNIVITHSFTHFDLELTPVILRAKDMKTKAVSLWLHPEEAMNAFPSLYRKAAKVFMHETLAQEDGS